MITQILNIFDPGTSNLLKLNWILIVIPFFIPYSLKKYANQNKISLLIFTSVQQLTRAFMPLSKFVNPFVFTSFRILSWNIIGLLPFNFTITTQFIITLSLALPLWSTPFVNSLVTKSWWPSHLTPANLPALLLAIFMSFIELVRCFLRPITLSLRLMINLTAGHLILSLVALSQTVELSKIYLIVGSIMILFVILEIAVAFIQSYVFSMLTLLYSKEN